MLRCVAIAALVVGCKNDEGRHRPPPISEAGERRAGFAEVGNRSFAEHPGAGAARFSVRGPDNNQLVVDVDNCSEQELRRIELVIGSDNVIGAGFERIVCASGGVSIAP